MTLAPVTSGAFSFRQCRAAVCSIAGDANPSGDYPIQLFALLADFKYLFCATGLNKLSMLSSGRP